MPLDYNQLFQALMERDNIASQNMSWANNQQMGDAAGYPATPQAPQAPVAPMPTDPMTGMPYDYHGDDWRQRLMTDYFADADRSRGLQQPQSPQPMYQSKDPYQNLGAGLFNVFGAALGGGGGRALNNYSGSGGTPNYSGMYNSLASTSDQRAKTAVKSGSGEVRRTLDNVGAHEYRYKDPADGAGTYYSPMAQELEKTKAGRSAVISREDGKKIVDYARLSGLMLSGLGDIHKRLKKLERK